MEILIAKHPIAPDDNQGERQVIDFADMEKGLDDLAHFHGTGALPDDLRESLKPLLKDGFEAIQKIQKVNKEIWKLTHHSPGIALCCGCSC